MRRSVTIAGFVFAIAAIALVGCAPNRAHGHGATTLEGAPLDPLASGSPATILLFTRTDCPVSNRYAPSVNRLVDEYLGKGARFFLVYIDPTEPAPAIARHVREYGYKATPVRDPRHALVELAGATVTPEAAVFDRTGRLTYRGRINDLYLEVGKPRARAGTRDLADAIEATLAGRPVMTPRTEAVGCIIEDLKR